MLDILKEVSIYLALAMACIAIAGFLKARKTRIIAKITELIQKAELSIQGSQMGADKKVQVIADLKENGIKFTAWVDRAIDCIVAYLNAKGGWLKDAAANGVNSTVDNAVAIAVEDGGNA